MDKQITVTTLYEETKLFGGKEWDNLLEARDAVQVVCRAYELDYVIAKRVKIDGVWVVDKRKAGHLPGKRDAELIRECIAIFDALVEDHPAAPKPEVGERDNPLLVLQDIVAAMDDKDEPAFISPCYGPEEMKLLNRAKTAITRAGHGQNE